MEALGPGHPLSVEVSPASYEHTKAALEALPVLKDCKTVLRRGGVGQPFPDGSNIAVTDAGNYIVDVYFKSAIGCIEKLRYELGQCTGVVAHSLVGSSKVQSVMYDNGVCVKPEVDVFHPLASVGDDFVVLVGSGDTVKVIRRPVRSADAMESDDYIEDMDIESSEIKSLLQPQYPSPLPVPPPLPVPALSLPVPAPLPASLDFDTIQNRGIN